MWKKSGENGVRGVSPEVLVLSEKSRYYRVMCSENKLKSQDKMGIELLAQKFLSFLKNPDIAVCRIRKPRDKSQEKMGMCSPGSARP
jgi:hypothetical protein